MRTLSRMAALAAIVLAVVACAPEPSSSLVRVSHPASLAGTTWRLVELDGRAPVAGVEATLQFTADQFAGSAPCNSFSGRFRYDPSTGALRFDQLISTKRACAIGPAGELEAAYFSALRTVTQADMDPAGRLVLLTGGTSLVFDGAGKAGPS